MPTPHADLVAAFAWVELFVGEIEIFAAEWADVILLTNIKCYNKYFEWERGVGMIEREGR
jgi:hypothetical protein